MAAADAVTDLLLIDCSVHDGQFPLHVLAAAGLPWIGAIGKLSEGTRYRYDEWATWFFQRARATPRYGIDWGMGGYCYWRAGQDPVEQGKTFLSVYERAGGRGHGDLWPMVDVERGGQDVAPTRAMVEDEVPRLVETLHDACGTPVILYTGELCRSLGISDRLGCEALITADYGPTLPRDKYERLGFSYGASAEEPGSLLGWQGVGVVRPGEVQAAWKLPRTTPAGDRDISTVTIAGGGQDALRWIQRRMFVTG